MTCLLLSQDISGEEAQDLGLELSLSNPGLVGVYYADDLDQYFILTDMVSPHTWYWTVGYFRDGNRSRSFF